MMVESLPCSSLRPSVLMTIDGIFEQALDHVILGMFISTCTSRNTVLTIDSVGNSKQEEIFCVEVSC